MLAPLFSGPVTSVLVNLWDCRRVAMVGTLVATVAFVVSIFAPNIPTLIFTYGFLGGKFNGISKTVIVCEKPTYANIEHKVTYTLLSIVKNVLCGLYFLK